MDRTHSETTRDRLVAAGARLLWERSYSAASVDDVCRLADARKGSFYHFFASKTALALEVVSSQWVWLRTQAFEVVEHGEARGLARVAALVARLSDLLAPSANGAPFVLGCPFGHLGQEMAHQEEALRRAVASVFDAQATFLERWLAEAVALGEAGPGDTPLRARQMLALMEGAWLLAKVSDDSRQFARLCQALPAIVAPAAVGVDTVGHPPPAAAIPPTATAAAPPATPAPAPKPAALPELD